MTKGGTYQTKYKSVRFSVGTVYAVIDRVGNLKAVFFFLQDARNWSSANDGSTVQAVKA